MKSYYPTIIALLNHNFIKNIEFFGVLLHHCPIAVHDASNSANKLAFRKVTAVTYASLLKISNDITSSSFYFISNASNKILKTEIRKDFRKTIRKYIQTSSRDKETVNVKWNEWIGS